jgi:hypothetical protein
LITDLAALKEALRKRVPKDGDSPGCQLCKWILADLEAHNGKLEGGGDLDLFGKPIFPKSGEVMHLKLEGFVFIESEL